METFIEQIKVEQITAYTNENNEFAICRYIGEEPYKYSTWIRGDWKTKKLQSQAIIFCIRRKDSEILAIIMRFRGMSTAIKFFDEQIDAIRSGKLKIECNYI